MNQFDTVSIGEAVIDFSMCGTGPMGNPAYEMNPGGAPSNVLVALSRLGGSAAYVGMLGRDLFADHILRSFARLGVNTDGVRRTDAASTQMTFVSLDEEGDRFFNLVKGSGTDYLMAPEDVDLSIIDNAAIVHSPIGMARRHPGAETLDYVLSYAKKKGKLVSYDPNYRPGMYRTMEECRQFFMHGLQYADIVKVSEEEMAIITGRDETDVEAGGKEIFEMGKKAVFVTQGAKGTYYVCEKGSGFVPSFKVNAVDTTGCGDAFMGTIHYMLLHESELSMEEMVIRANAVGALCAQKPGAFDAMPTYAEMQRFLAERS